MGEEVQAVMMIQASYRGHIGRREARLEMLYRFGHDEDQEKGADSLELRALGEQRRRMKERRDLEQAQNLARHTARDEIAREQRLAAMQIQDRYREHAHVKEVQAHDLEVNMSMGATKIQSVNRGRVARRHREALQEGRNQEHAAVHIQATFRMHQSAGKVEELSAQKLALRSDAENAGLAANKSAAAAGMTALRAHEQAIQVEEEFSQNVKLPPVYRKVVDQTPPPEVAPHPTHTKLPKVEQARGSGRQQHIAKNTSTGREDLRMGNAEFGF